LTDFAANQLKICENSNFFAFGVDEFYYMSYFKDGKPHSDFDKLTNEFIDKLLTDINKFYDQINFRYSGLSHLLASYLGHKLLTYKNPTDFQYALISFAKEVLTKQIVFLRHSPEEKNISCKDKATLFSQLMESYLYNKKQVKEKAKGKLAAAKELIHEGIEKIENLQGEFKEKVNGKKFLIDYTKQLDKSINGLIDFTDLVTEEFSSKIEHYLDNEEDYNKNAKYVFIISDRVSRPGQITIEVEKDCTKEYAAVVKQKQIQIESVVAKSKAIVQPKIQLPDSSDNILTDSFFKGFYPLNPIPSPKHKGGIITTNTPHPLTVESKGFYNSNKVTHDNTGYDKTQHDYSSDDSIEKILREISLEYEIRKGLNLLK
jgi:hypothetical protein